MIRSLVIFLFYFFDNCEPWTFLPKVPHLSVENGESQAALGRIRRIKNDPCDFTRFPPPVRIELIVMTLLCFDRSVANVSG